MPGIAHPPASSSQDIAFVPVPGQVVFCVCLLLIAMCVIWLLMLVSKGLKLEEDR